jgi:glycine/sarcosine N-methyltransferase
MDMSLYASLAPSYDELFPLPPKAAPFLDSLAPKAGKGRRALDCGCATGSQALALAGLGWNVAGIDSEEAMTDIASSRARSSALADRASFACADILDIGRLFAQTRFDLILCLGNTLPHIRGEGAASFLAQARGLLEKGGALVLQLLNFALPEVTAGYQFPDIEAAGCVMRRSYRGTGNDREKGALRFVVELSQAGRSEIAETLLQPITPRGLLALLRGAGFGTPRLFPSWDSGLGLGDSVPCDPVLGVEAFDEGRSPYLIAVARALD